MPRARLSLEGSRIVSLRNLHDTFHRVTNHSAVCQAPVKFIGEVTQDGLSSTFLAVCENSLKNSNSLQVIKLR